MKIKNIMQKFTTLSLALVLSFSIFTSSYANNSIDTIHNNKANSHVIHEVINDNGDIVEQIIEHDGIRYKYENNKDYTKTTTFKANKVTSAVKYHNEPDYIYIEDVTNGTTQKFNISEFVEVNPKSTQSYSTQSVESDVESEFGRPYSNKTLWTFNTDGRTVKINETYYYQHYKDLDYVLIGKLGIGVASTLFGINTKSILSLATGAVTIHDGYLVAKDPTTLIVYNLNLVYDRVCSVNSKNVYRAGKTERWRIITADAGGTGFDYKGVSEDFDFDDIQALRNTAVEIYIERFE